MKGIVRPARLMATMVLVATVAASPTRATEDPAVCAGDCDVDRRVSIDELVRGIRIALGGSSVNDCATLDADKDAAVTVDELVLAVRGALQGCQQCAAYSPLRNAYFGDLHVHTAYSFDVYAFDGRATPEQAFRFGQGESVLLPPLDAMGQGTVSVRLERPLDFVAVTDHSEFLGEVAMCTTPGSPAYDSGDCRAYREGGNSAATQFGVQLTNPDEPMHSEFVCGPDGTGCQALAGEAWTRAVAAAQAANDDSPACRFTAFVAYEYSGTPGLSTMHRNVIFRNEQVPFPTSFFDQPTPQGLWTELKATCLDSGTGCDVLAIPHNPNESNGKMFFVEYPGAADLAEERAQARTRVAMEPVVEIYQHKGDSECMNGLSGLVGEPDEQCNFEKRRRTPLGRGEDCKNGTGNMGTAGGGCVSRMDFVRNALLAGLQEDDRLGVNPYQLGIIASTDTHNGTPGFVNEETFIGHRGTDDNTVAQRLGYGSLTAGGVIFSPGGLAAVWAEENSRASIFDALRRREVFGTSGPRITVRFFGGWNLPPDLCADPNMLPIADAYGVPMGGVLPPAAGVAPRFLVSALRDPGTQTHPGMPLQRIQIVKGWVDGQQSHQQVFDVAGDPNSGADVDLATCTPQGTGFDSLCTVWSDPTFAPTQRAFYYVRVLENPTCRWSTYTCNALAPEQRPQSCSDPGVPKTVQERAWTSPIWYQPPA